MTKLDEDALEANLFAFLSRKYAQRADARQREMGLAYTEAETHDLAKEIARFIERKAPAPAAAGERPVEKRARDYLAALPGDKGYAVTGPEVIISDLLVLVAKLRAAPAAAGECDVKRLTMNAYTVVNYFRQRDMKKNADAVAELAAAITALEKWKAKHDDAIKQRDYAADVWKAAEARNAALEQQVSQQAQDIVTLGQMAGRTADAEARNAALVEALHRISLGSQNNGTTKEDKP